MAIYIKTEEIKYLDVDKNNKLTNKALLNYLQETAAWHGNSIGDGLKDKNVTHTAWLVLNWKIKIMARPKEGETLSIKTWAKKIERCYSIREFEIYLNDKLIAIASSKWILVNSDTGKITRVPQERIEKYDPILKSVFKEEFEEKLKEPENQELSYEDTIGRTKIDTNNHLNNVYYLDYAIEALPEEVYQNSEIQDIEIMYKKAIKYKEHIKCYYGTENENHVITIKGEEEKDVRAIIKMK